MIIDCISDLHGFYPELEGGDLLIVSGDLTARDTENDWHHFEIWICNQKYKEKIIIAGNHDNFLQSSDEPRMWKYWDKVGITYLCDSGTEFEGLKIWGSPWTQTFPGMNPHCKAFTVDTEEELAVKFSLIPEDIDILITHSPPDGILDWNKEGKNCGSSSLFNIIKKFKNLKLCVFGHIHESYSMIDTKLMEKSLPMLLSKNRPLSLPIFVNASQVNEHYQPVNKPVRVIL